MKRTSMQLYFKMSSVAGILKVLCLDTRMNLCQIAFQLPFPELQIPIVHLATALGCLK